MSLTAFKTFFVGYLRPVDFLQTLCGSRERFEIDCMCSLNNVRKPGDFRSTGGAGIYVEAGKDVDGVGGIAMRWVRW